MTPIALILNLLLGGLLVAALALGVRLDRRLKALRESQAGFIKAVADLDSAAIRTQAGLVQCRAAADEARELLHERTEKAKAQAARLENLLERSAKTPAEPVARTPEPPVLTLSPKDALRPLRGAPQPARSRAVIDDDLFDTLPGGAAGLQRDLAEALGRRQ